MLLLYIFKYVITGSGNDGHSRSIFQSINNQGSSPPHSNPSVPSILKISIAKNSYRINIQVSFFASPTFIIIFFSYT